MASTILSVDVDAPARGYVVATANGYIQFHGVADNIAECNVTTGATIEAEHRLRATGRGNSGDSSRAVMSQSRVLPVAAGKTTFNFVCQRTAAESVSIFSVDMTGLFVPKRY